MYDFDPETKCLDVKSDQFSDNSNGYVDYKMKLVVFYTSYPNDY